MDTCDNYNHETFVIVDSDGPDNGGSYTATALQPSFGYLFKVAAINRNGVGSFTVVTTMDGLLNVYSACMEEIYNHTHIKQFDCYDTF